MIRVRWRASLIAAVTLALVAGALGAGAPASASAIPDKLVEVPFLQHQVAANKLPPVRSRLPAEPSLVRFDDGEKTPGLHGGTMKMVMGRAKDIRQMVVYGYARLVGYTPDLTLEPDLLKDIEVEGNRRFTLHLRKGHRWSDGEPFTAEDFRYWWEHMANNKQLSPLGPPPDMMVNGKKPTFEVLDETTVRYTWDSPNPFFLPALAGARPMFIYAPKHYLKQFHKAFADPDRLQRLVDRAGEQDWAGLHGRRDRPYRSDNPDLPVLQPWHNTTAPPSQRFVFRRNPYFHRVDASGRQLPYVDRVSISIADKRLVAAKTASGEADLQARNLTLSDYTFLKEAEDRNDYAVRLWRTGVGSERALQPNLNAADPMWRELNQDARFRRALSLAVNRYELNQVIFYGLGDESADTVLPRSPLFRETYKNAYADYDLERARELLDAVGLDERNDRGVRLLPNGEPAEIIVDTSGESTTTTDILELIQDSWAKVGIDMYIRPSQRELFRNRVFSGKAVMSVWSGITNGIPTATTPPSDIAPTNKYQLQWPDWGQYVQTNGEAGEKPSLPEVQRLVSLFREWQKADDKKAQRRIWHEMLKIRAEQVFTIGTVNGIPQPIVVHNDLRNVPEKAYYNWSPTAYFGVYRPDTFWFDDAQRRAH